MPERIKRLTLAEIMRLLEEGSSYADISELDGRTVQTLRNMVTQGKKRTPDNNPPGWGFAPWWVRRAHANTQTGRRLRYSVALESGEPIASSFIEQDVRAWLARVKDNDFVISYHPDTPPNRLEKKGGFFFRPRRPGDSPGIMQIPDESECPPSQSQLDEWSNLFD
ncbi:hypothetical protein GCM10009700_35430 [Brevibacterium sanguinis]|uniref:hypothetical protein n=1 Tax=Brevibacterium sanguinis TaxID=232444 RepID=UPI0031DA07BF